MTQDLRHGKSGLGLQLDHTSDKLLGFGCELVWEVEVSLKDELVKVLKVRGFEGDCAAEHREKKNS